MVCLCVGIDLYFDISRIYSFRANFNYYGKLVEQVRQHLHL
jgi:hypothetical protein